MYTISAFLVHRGRCPPTDSTQAHLHFPGMDDMKTHIDIDEDLLAKAMKLGRHRSKRAAVQAALQAYVSWQLRKQLLDLQGKIRWEGDLDQMRGRIKEKKS